MEKREIEALVENSTCLVNEQELVKAFTKIMTKVEKEPYELYRFFVMEDVSNERGSRTLPFLYHYILPSAEVGKIDVDAFSRIEPTLGIHTIDKGKREYDAIVRSGRGIRIDSMNFFRNSSRLIDGVDDEGRVVLSSSLPDFGRYGYLKLFILSIVKEQIRLGRRIDKEELAGIVEAFSFFKEANFSKQF